PDVFWKDRPAGGVYASGKCRWLVVAKINRADGRPQRNGCDQMRTESQTPARRPEYPLPPVAVRVVKSKPKNKQNDETCKLQIVGGVDALRCLDSAAERRDHRARLGANHAGGKLHT